MSKPDCLRPKTNKQSTGFIRRLVAEKKLDCSKIKCPSDAIKDMCKIKKTGIKVKLPKAKFSYTVPPFDTLEDVKDKKDIKEVFVYLYGIYRNKSWNSGTVDEKLEEIFKRQIEKGIEPKRPFLPESALKALTEPFNDFYYNQLGGITEKQLKAYQSSRKKSESVDKIEGSMMELFNKIKVASK